MESQDKRPVFMGTYVKNNKHIEGQINNLQSIIRTTSKAMIKHKRMIFWLLGLTVVNTAISLLAIL